MALLNLICRGSLFPSRLKVHHISQIKTFTNNGFQYFKAIPKLPQLSANSRRAALGTVLGSSGALLTYQYAGLPQVQCRELQQTPKEEVFPSLSTEGDKSDEDKAEAVPAEAAFDWQYFWTILRPQFLYLMGAVGAALVVAFANVEVPYLLGAVVNVLARHVDGGGREAFWGEVSPVVGRLVRVYVAQAAFTVAYIACLTRMGEGMAVDLRQNLYEALLRQDIAFFDRHRTGELVNRLTADVQDFKSSFKMCVSQGIRCVTQMVGSSVAIYRVSPSLALGTAALVGLVVALGSAFGALLRGFSRAAQAQVSLATGVAEEALGGIRTVRSFAAEQQEAERFRTELETSRGLNEALGAGIGLFQGGSNLFLNSVVALALTCGGGMVAEGRLQPGDVMLVLTAAQSIQRSLGQLSSLFGYAVRGASAGCRVMEYMKLQPSIPLKGGIVIPHHSLFGDISFNDVSFSYPSRPDQEVLQGFSLKIPAGKVVALVGESGAGKSTVGQLLERFYDVDNGSITIDGRDVRDLDPQWLRGRLVASIQQEPVLLGASVRENIRYGRPEATDREVYEAAKAANAHTFISAFPRGYDTPVGERGTQLSGGQKQRVAIARALLRDPRVLVLDEATSALDAASEREVQLSLEKCATGRTVLVVAHRLSTVAGADMVAVVRGGRVVELGTHQQLKKKGGYYAELIKLQQK